MPFDLIFAKWKQCFMPIIDQNSGSGSVFFHLVLCKPNTKHHHQHRYLYQKNVCQNIEFIPEFLELCFTYLD